MIGNKIKILREFRNYSQEYMADKLGISQNAYSRIELNKSKLTTDAAEKIAELLQIPLDDLLSKDNPIITFNNNQIAKGYIYNNFEIQKDLYENIISNLQQELNDAKKREEKLMHLLEKRSA
ncbi:MAG: helix-turn-helix transcriptional regulator [Parafilimonas sp.]